MSIHRGYTYEVGERLVYFPNYDGSISAESEAGARDVVVVSDDGITLVVRNEDGSQQSVRRGDGYISSVGCLCC